MCTSIPLRSTASSRWRGPQINGQIAVSSTTANWLDNAGAVKTWAPAGTRLSDVVMLSGITIDDLTPCESVLLASYRRPRGRHSHEGDDDSVSLQGEGYFQLVHMFGTKLRSFVFTTGPWCKAVAP